MISLFEGKFFADFAVLGVISETWNRCGGNLAQNQPSSGSSNLCSQLAAVEIVIDSFLDRNKRKDSTSIASVSGIWLSTLQTCIY